MILDEIRKCTGTLIQDQYGNYVIQHVMKHGRPQDRQMVINEVKSRMLLYSQVSAPVPFSSFSAWSEGRGSGEISVS